MTDRAEVRIMVPEEPDGIFRICPDGYCVRRCSRTELWAAIEAHADAWANKVLDDYGHAYPPRGRLSWDEQADLATAQVRTLLGLEPLS